MSLNDQKQLIMQKYASESIKVMKILLYIKDSLPAILTPVEKSLDLLGAIQYRLSQIQDSEIFLLYIPQKLVVKADFIPYYSNPKNSKNQLGDQEEQRQNEEKILAILKQAERVGEESFQKDILEEKQREQEGQQMVIEEEEYKLNEVEKKGKNKTDLDKRNKNSKPITQQGMESNTSMSSSSLQNVQVTNGQNKSNKSLQNSKGGKRKNQGEKEMMNMIEEEDIQNGDSGSGDQSNQEEENENEEDDGIDCNGNGEFDNEMDDDIFDQARRGVGVDDEDMQENDKLDPLSRLNSANSSTSLNSDIGNLLGVNDSTITDYFNLQEPPAFFQTSLFDYQKQALTWMLYKENALTFEDAARPEVTDRPRELNEFWCESILFDGSLLYYNEYSYSFTKKFQKSVANLQKGGILADEMGLGKTVMALSLVASNMPKINHKQSIVKIGIGEEKRKKQKKNNRNQQEVQDNFDMYEEKKKQGLIRAGTLIILPLSVLTQWANEVTGHFQKDSLYYFEYYDSRSRSDPILHLYDVVFTTYNILGMEYKNYFISGNPHKTNLFNYYWHRIILDEAHTIKGKGNNCSKGAYNLQAESRWCLTGTPIHNCFDDLYSLIYFLKYDTFQDYYWWNKHINNCNNREEVFKLLQNILKPILLRRTKKSKYHDGTSIVKIPKKSQKIVMIPFSKLEKQLYTYLQQRSQKALKNILLDKNKFSSSYLHIFSIMTKLRQMCDHSLLLLNKVPMVQVKQHIDNLEKQIRQNSSNSVQVEGKAYNLFIKNLVENAMMNNIAVEPLQIPRNNINNNNNNINLGNQRGHNPIQQQQANQNQFQKEVIQKLQKNEMDECFCAEEYKEEVSMLQCGHFYHDSCIRDFYERKMQQSEQPQCPICRTDFTLEDITSINFSQAKDEAKRLSERMREQVISQIEAKKEKVQILKIFQPMSSKLKIIVKETLKVQAQKEKVIIYSQFLGFLSQLQKVLNQKDVRYTRLDGTMNKKDRATAIKSFSEYSEITVILISLKAGAFGLNLTAANHVFICDPWYNPAIEEQAIERCHRIGQTKRVHVINFIMDLSIEQRILECQKTKRNMIQNTLYIQKGLLTEQEKDQEVQEKMKEIRYIIGFNNNQEEEMEGANQMKLSNNDETTLDIEEDIGFENMIEFSQNDEDEECIVKEIEV